jgi:hypothetical protein
LGVFERERERERERVQERKRRGSTPTKCFVGLAYQGKDIVFRFIKEYSSLMDFGP